MENQSASGGPGALAQPFDLSEPDAYAKWREQKLENAASASADSTVELKADENPSAAQIAAIQQGCRLFNMARYAFVSDTSADPAVGLTRLGWALGLRQMDRTRGAGSHGVARLAARTEAPEREYIPFTDRALSWHTDGYYNFADAQIRGVIMHCVVPAAIGGANTLLDPELAYIAVRDQTPDYIAALMRADAMTIPANVDPSGRIVRGPRTGPVFSVDQRNGSLHMRYTARTRSVQWAQDSLVREAARALREHLMEVPPGCARLKLNAGEGIVCNNVLHTREAFRDADTGPTRLHLRARYHERVSGT